MFTKGGVYINILLETRCKLGITQQNIANKLNISRQYICAIENGTRKPSVDTAKAIAKVLGFDWTKFFE